MSMIEKVVYIQHDDGTSRSCLLALAELETFFFDVGDGREESCDVCHTDGLTSDTNAQTSLSSDPVDQEEGAGDSSDELDDSENGSCKQFLILTLSTKQSEEVRGIDGDGLCARPLGKKLRAETDVESVCVVGHEEHLLDVSHEALAHGSLLFLGQLVFNIGDFLLNDFVVLWQSTDASEVGNSMFTLAVLDKITR